MRVNALGGRLVFIMHRQTLGADIEGKRYENAAVECGYEDYKLLAFELGLLVGCTEAIQAVPHRGDDKEVTAELKAFADWFNQITDPRDAWMYRLKHLPKIFMEEWRQAWDKANAPLVSVEQKAFSRLSPEEQKEVQTEGSPLEPHESASPTA